MIDRYIENYKYHFIIGTILFLISSVIILESGTNDTVSSMTVTACRLATVIVGVWSIRYVIIQLKASATTANADFIYKLNTEFMKNNDILKIYRKLLKSYAYNTALFDTKEKAKKISSSGIQDITESSKGYFNDDDQVSIGIYLIFFETLYYFYKRNLITIDDINDLFAQRFFIAVHNPDVQDYLIKNCIFYKNVFKLYHEWIKLRDDNGQLILVDEEKEDESRGKYKGFRLNSLELSQKYKNYNYYDLIDDDWRNMLSNNINTHPNGDNQNNSTEQSNKVNIPLEF